MTKKIKECKVIDISTYKKAILLFQKSVYDMKKARFFCQISESLDTW